MPYCRPTVHPVQKGSGIEHFQTTRTGLSDTGTRQPWFLSSCSKWEYDIIKNSCYVIIYLGFIVLKHLIQEWNHKLMIYSCKPFYQYNIDDILVQLCFLSSLHVNNGKLWSERRYRVSHIKSDRYWPKITIFTPNRKILEKLIFLKNRIRPL